MVKAAILNEYNQPLVVEDITLNDPGPRDVRVRIDASGVCHTDLSIATGGTPMPAPVILGHEGAGTVLETGAEVTHVRPGDRVIASFVPACGTCWYCLRDRSNLCEYSDAVMTTTAARTDGTSIAGMAGLGTFAEEMLVDQSMLVKIESDLPSEHLALIGCGVATGVGAALITARVEPGSSVAVVGCGGVGQSVVQGAKVAGASRIFAIDPVEMKRKLAARLGASDLIDPADGDPTDQVRAATGGRGVDYAFEVIGLPATILQAFNTARRGGTVVVVGMARADASVTFPAAQLLTDEKRMMGSVYGTSQVRRDFPRYVHLAESGQLDLDAMVSRRIGLHDVDEAFRAMEAGEVVRSVIAF